MMFLRKGAVMSFSRKQKLNMQSSAEGELVGIEDALPWYSGIDISLRRRANRISCTNTTNLQYS
eukprot:CCRYP_014938-RA/>CCRYP_014938-RA protein AED:0.43 eAED:0.68 QI:0/-1/0/1/-1/0/1/0/63